MHCGSFLFDQVNNRKLNFAFLSLESHFTSLHWKESIQEEKNPLMIISRKIDLYVYTTNELKNGFVGVNL